MILGIGTLKIAPDAARAIVALLDVDDLVGELAGGDERIIVLREELIRLAAGSGDLEIGDDIAVLTVPEMALGRRDAALLSAAVGRAVRGRTVSARVRSIDQRLAAAVTADTYSLAALGAPDHLDDSDDSCAPLSGTEGETIDAKTAAGMLGIKVRWMRDLGPRLGWQENGTRWRFLRSRIEREVQLWAAGHRTPPIETAQSAVIPK